MRLCVHVLLFLKYSFFSVFNISAASSKLRIPSKTRIICNHKYVPIAMYICRIHLFRLWATIKKSVSLLIVYTQIRMLNFNAKSYLIWIKYDKKFSCILVHSHSFSHFFGVCCSLNGMNEFGYKEYFISTGKKSNDWNMIRTILHRTEHFILQ